MKDAPIRGKTVRLGACKFRPRLACVTAAAAGGVSDVMRSPGMGWTSAEQARSAALPAAASSPSLRRIVRGTALAWRHHPRPPGPGRGTRPGQRDGELAAAGEPLPVLPDPVPRDGEAGAGPVGAARQPVRPSPPVPGTRWPGCCWRWRRWRPPGCWRPPGRSTAGSATATTGWLPRC